MIPVLEAMQMLLLSNTALAAEVGDRIYGPQRTMPELSPPLQKAIVLQRAGGPRQATVPISRPRVSVRCHGKDVQEAEALYRLLATVFYDVQGRMRGPRTIGPWRMFWAELSEPSTSIEPESGWPVSSGTLDSEWATIT